MRNEKRGGNEDEIFTSISIYSSDIETTMIAIALRGFLKLFQMKNIRGSVLFQYNSIGLHETIYQYNRHKNVSTLEIKAKYCVYVRIY